MFTGQYQHTIDSKGRLMIPARYRDLLEDGAYVTKGLDNNLMVFTCDTFELMAQRINQKSITDPKARSLKRFIFGNGERVEVDKAGRILIPQFLRSAAGLESDVVVTGMGSHFEVFSPSSWKVQLLLMNDSEADPERFIEFEIPSG
jgi:MraZ protein